MFNHEPAGYPCPFCLLVAGGQTPLSGPEDVVRRTERAAVIVSARWWPNNPGHVLVVPRAHHENLYDLPNIDGHAVHDLVREVAVALRRTYACDGVSTRQHNEPAGSQDAWHYHVHVFPRYVGDDLYATRPRPEPPTAAERRVYAVRLRDYFESQPPTAPPDR